ncbi:MAG: hypothetical protein MJY56_04110 [Bacteroidales bacterium]|nr:hypothetical protein [Bacteroidales bacterium]
MKIIFRLMSVLALAGGLAACDKEPEIKSAVTTLDATDITLTSAILHGKVSLPSEQLSNVIFGFIYSEDANPSAENGTTIKVSELESDHSFSLAIDGLTPSTTYYYTTYVKYSSGISEYGNVKSFATESPTDYSFGCEAVDLGLSVKWASYNVGATSPEEYGSYFAYGETVEKSSYDWSKEGDYKWGIYDESAPPKYGMTKYTGYVEGGDGLITLLPEDDAATANWGTKWRTPTRTEIKELLDEMKCEWIWDDDRKGYIVRGKTGNSIFLPLSGGSSGSTVGSKGYIVSSSVDESKPRYMYVCTYGYGFKSCSDGTRKSGCPVRAVTEY